VMIEDERIVSRPPLWARPAISVKMTLFCNLQRRLTPSCGQGQVGVERRAAERAEREEREETPAHGNLLWWRPRSVCLGGASGPRAAGAKETVARHRAGAVDWARSLIRLLWLTAGPIHCVQGVRDYG